MQEMHVVFDGVTATTEAEPINIEGAEKVTLVCKRADHGAGGTSAFSATVSDGTNSVTYNKWIDNVTNANDEQLTRIASKDLVSAVTNFVSMSPEDTYETITITVTETTRGTHSAWLVIERGER